MYIIASPPVRLLTTGSSTSRGSSKRASFTLVMISAEHVRRVLAEPYVRLDLRKAGIALRRDELDAFRGRDAPLQRRGDEPLHGFGGRTRIRGVDEDDALLHLRILAQRELRAGLNADEQHHGAQHECEHRPLHEEIGETRIHSATLSSTTTRTPR